MLIETAANSDGLVGQHVLLRGIVAYRLSHRAVVVAADHAADDFIRGSARLA
jgi:hypothetical protein